jgi:S1-C subfamily serine protease
LDANIGRVVLPLGRIQVGGSITPLGTCFAVGSRRFATAAHVVGPSDEGLIAIVGRTDSLSDYQDTTDTSVSGTLLKLVAYSPLHDVAILEFVDPSNTMMFGYSLGVLDELRVGTPVVSLGYPHADHGRLVLTQQATMVGARVLLGAGGVKIKHAVLNTQTRPGQSGGPVFTADGRRVCAMVTGGYAPTGAQGSISLGGDRPTDIASNHPCGFR